MWIKSFIIDNIHYINFIMFNISKFDPITGTFLQGTWFEFDSNLVNYPCLEDIKVAGCKEPMTEDIQKVLKKVGMDNAFFPCCKSWCNADYGMTFLLDN